MPAALLGHPATVIALVDAFYDRAPAHARYDNHLGYLQAHGESAYAEALAAGFAQVGNEALAAHVLHNMGLAAPTVPRASYDALEAALAQALAAYPTSRGQVILNLTKILPQLEGDATFGAAAAAYNGQQYAAYVVATDPDSVSDRAVAPASPRFALLPGETAQGTPAGRVTGNLDVVFNFDDADHQIAGLDLNGDGTIALDGVENDPPVAAAQLRIVDAYPRNPLDQGDAVNNYLGDLRFDGRSVGGDGTASNGNVVLGGLGADVIFGGVGNDFLAGGGVARDRFALQQPGLAGTGSHAQAAPAAAAADPADGGAAAVVLVGIPMLPA